MKTTLFLSSLLLGVAQGTVNFWVEPEMDDFNDATCGNMRAAYSDVVRQVSEDTLSPVLYSIISGVHPVDYGDDRRNLRGQQDHRELVDCGICESNPPSSIMACCILIPYQHCGVCMEGGGRRRLEEDSELEQEHRKL